MAERPAQMILPLIVLIGALAVVGTIGASLIALLGVGDLHLRARDWQMLGFTLWQAFLSALFSVALAIPLARALWRTTFPGRRELIFLLSAPMLFPVIVVVVVISGLWGRQGPINDLLGLAGLHIDLFGLQGILIAHIFLNLPLAMRMLLSGWAQVPAEHVMLASSLRLSPRAQFRVLDWPMLRRIAPQAFMACFMVCLTSFVIVLTLGGGPKATSLELGIYQALRFDFQPAHAAALALLQLFAGSLVVLASVLIGQGETRTGLDIAGIRPRGSWHDVVVIATAAMFLVLPMLWLLRGASGLEDLPVSVIGGTLRSLLIGSVGGAISLAVGLPFALWIGTKRQGAKAVEVIGTLPRAMSPLALATGLYLILNQHLSVTALALPLAMGITGLLLVPFFLRIVTPAIAESHARFHDLAANLRLSPAQMMFGLYLPRARREIAEATALCTAFALGEMSVLSLLAGPEQANLSMQMQALLGAYRMDQSMAAAVVLIALSLLVYGGIIALGGRNDP